jgi:putative transposase
MILRVARDLASLISSALRSRAQLAAENLFLKKQLALYLERQVKPRRADDATRMALVALSRFVDWRHLLTIVKPDTLLRWHRKGFRLFWRWKSRRPGRQAIPAELRALIATMAAANRIWGEERIAAELLVKLGIESLRGQCGDICHRDRRARAGARRHGAPSSGTTHARCSPVISLLW